MQQITEPTLLSIPSILFRTVLRTLARGLFLLAALTLTIGLTLAISALFLSTWRSARTTKTQALTDLLIAGQRTYKAYKQ